MIPEIGHFALILACCIAIVLSVIPFVGVYFHDDDVIGYAPSLARGLFFLLCCSMLALGYAFATDDFSVLYVAEHSNSQLPSLFKIAAIWGGHEGSLLLWIFDMTLWMMLISVFSKKLEASFIAQVLSVMAMVVTGFCLFTLLTSNPFERLLIEIPAEGRDLNPFLQDIGLVVHPPMLYMGYVGFSVSFAFAIAALLSGRLDSAWVRWCRPWTLAAWIFLTGGIALGSWWAYYELGWGGWWFWDPVENASFMPWLMGTALLHALMMTEQRGVLRHWTVLLAIFSFSLSLLGTFIVRSGVLTSVHSFASDPERGLFILLLLGLSVGGALLLFALRAPQMKSATRFDFLSKETLLLTGNIVLVISCVTVLLGTLYPLLIDALGLGKISVGAPYFNLIFVPLTLLACVLMGLAPLIRWKKHKSGQHNHFFKMSLISSLMFGLLISFLAEGALNMWVISGLSLAAWVAATTMKVVLEASKTTHWHTPKLSLSRWGMVFAHLGIAISVIGATMVSNYSEEKSVRLGPNQSMELAGYNFVFIKSRLLQGPNYVSEQALIRVDYQGQPITILKPERRRYEVRMMDMSEAGIDWGMFRDLYVTLGDPLDNGAFAVRISYKPFVRWLWFGALMMMFGGCLAIADKRYRFIRQSSRDVDSSIPKNFKPLATKSM